MLPGVMTEASDEPARQGEADVENRGTAELTVLLQAWHAGEPEAAEHLFERVYPELRSIAQRQLRLRRNVTFQPTEVVSEAYLKLERAGRLEWNSRLQFFGLAARIVRQVLVDRLRSKVADKRGSGVVATTIGDNDALVEAPDVDLLDLDQALDRLATLDARAARIVELRYFGGLTVPETARLLDIGTATVSRSWQMARAWLRRALDQEPA